MLSNLPPDLRARTYMAADGRAAWRAGDVAAVLDLAHRLALEPRVVEAWMVFEEGDFAGTHCTAIHIDGDRSSSHRLQLEGEPDPWGAIRAFVANCPAPREVHAAYADTIRYHVEFEERFQPPFD